MASHKTARPTKTLGSKSKWLIALSGFFYLAGALTELILHNSMLFTLLSGAILILSVVVYDRVRYESFKISTLRKKTEAVDSRVLKLQEKIEELSREKKRTPRLEQNKNQASESNALNPLAIHKIDDIHKLAREQRYSLPSEWMDSLDKLLSRSASSGNITFIGDPEIFRYLKEITPQEKTARLDYLDLRSPDGGRAQSQHSAAWTSLIIQPYAGLLKEIQKANLSQYMIRWMHPTSQIVLFKSPISSENDLVLGHLSKMLRTSFASTEEGEKKSRLIAVYDLEEE